MNPPFIHSPNSIPDWNQWPVPSPEITRIVVGNLDEDTTADRPLPGDFAQRFPNLKCLHLWRLAGITSLPSLPMDLLELDVRQCPDLTSLPDLPGEIEVLVVTGALGLTTFRQRSSAMKLTDLALTNCPVLAESSVHDILKNAPLLRELNLSGCELITSLPALAPTVERCFLANLPKLHKIPQFGDFLQTLDVSGSGIRSLPDIPQCLKYLDLRKTAELVRLPNSIGCLRTLLLQGSGLGKCLPDELFGNKDDFNSAPLLNAHMERERTPDHEVKILLLGDGRAGKSSLARRLANQGFDPEEKTTHGIRLWSFTIPFTPIDEPDCKAEAKVNVWDFAGQDLYHYTHRLFYQNKAIFVFCDTTAGSGANPEGDKQNEDLLPDGWDVPRDLGYWRDQVEALGSRPGFVGPPPLLVVRTKADRDDEVEPGYRQRQFLQKNGAALEGLNPVISFGASTQLGLPELRAALADAVAQVLGARGKREIRDDALRVKNELRDLMQANANEFQNAEQENRASTPPHPTLLKPTFDGIVRKHCQETIYEEHPEYLLQQWHWSGFLYWQPQFFSEIVLDQRWAINGIYVGLDRRLSWPKLLAKGGRFTAKDLADWGWNAAGYSLEHQRLFIQFMLSCGMVFRFGERSGESEFVMLNALPEKSADTERLASDYRGSATVSRRVGLTHRSLSCDAVLALLSRLGSHWRKTALLWRWGGQFESFRNYTWDPERARTFVYLDWQPYGNNSFGGTLEVLQYGDDEAFLEEILKECQQIRGFEKVDFPEFEKHETQEVDIENLVEPRGAPTDAAPDEFHADGIEIGISFAGDSSNADLNWRDLPQGSIERWPRALTEKLTRFGFRVEQYRLEQRRAEIDQSADRQQYLDTLTDKDFMIAFLSKKYLESPWCMYEFMRIFLTRGPNGLQNTGKAKVGAYRDAYFSQTDVSQKKYGEFKKFWNTWYLDHEKRVLDEAKCRRSPNMYDAVNRAGEYAFGEWHRFISEEANLDQIAAAISGKGWKIHPIADDPREEDLSNWAKELMIVFTRMNRLFDLVVEAWDKKHYDRAQRFYLTALFGLDPDKSLLKDVLARAVDAPVQLRLIRNSILGEMQSLEAKGHCFSTWVDLANAVAPMVSKAGTKK